MRRRACSAAARLRLLVVLPAIFVAACAGTAPAPEGPAAQGGTGLVYHADFMAHDMGPAHPERPDRLRAVVSGLERAGLSASLAPIAPRMIEDRWITTVHTPAYLASLEAASAKGSVYLGADTMIGLPVQHQHCGIERIARAERRYSPRDAGPVRDPRQREAGASECDPVRIG